MTEKLAKTIDEWIDKEFYESDKRTVVCETHESKERIEEVVEGVVKHMGTNTSKVEGEVDMREGKAHILLTATAYSGETRESMLRTTDALLRDRLQLEGSYLLETKVVKVEGIFTRYDRAVEAWDMFPRALKESFDQAMKKRPNQEMSEYSLEAQVEQYLDSKGGIAGVILSVAVTLNQSQDGRGMSSEYFGTLAERTMQRVVTENKGISYLQDRLIKRLRRMDIPGSPVVESLAEIRMNESPVVVEVSSKPKTEDASFKDELGRYISIRMQTHDILKASEFLINRGVPVEKDDKSSVGIIKVEVDTFLKNYDVIRKLVESMRAKGKEVSLDSRNLLARQFIKIIESHYK